ncbi:MAG: hypothetical protein K5793_08425 [Nitrosarchaeum sp.]|nr:hypothetical protein [Nitrosarchaeum sp.]MCV0399067.1 hypothetical protein [Nitrosarchaeum sp.]
MIKLGFVDLEILHLGIKGNGTFNERDIENSNLKRLGVGRILDALASLKDRKLIELNKDGFFRITDLARCFLWDEKIPLRVRILRTLEIKSFSSEEMSYFLEKTEKEILDEMENLRKSNLVLMSPQRTESKIIRVFEILPDGIEKLKKVEKEGFEKEKEETSKPENDIAYILEQVIKDINSLEIQEEKKREIISKILSIKEKTGYFE